MAHFDSAIISPGPRPAGRGYVTQRSHPFGRSSHLLAVIFLSMLVLHTAVSQPYTNPTTVDLGTAGNYWALAGTALNINAGCTVMGNVGGTSVTNGGTVTGTTDINNAAVTTALDDLAAAKNDLAGRTPDDATLAVELAGLNLGRGIYAGPGTFSINGTLTLTGTASDIFIFKTTTTLITGATCVVNLVGGARPANVFWEIGSAAEIEGDFQGNILAGTYITQAGGVIDGKTLGLTAVTLGGSAVLPVELVSFTVSGGRTNAELRWSTASEVNNYGFEIERRQTADWQKTGFVAGAGTSNAPRDYSYTDKNLAPGRYTYRLKQVDNDGTFSYYGSTEVEVGLAAKKFELESNYPNPFNPSTTIVFTVGEDGQTSLIVSNVLGQKVMTLFEGNATAGRLYQVQFDASDLPGGLYFANLESGEQHMTRKMVLMK